MAGERPTVVVVGAGLAGLACAQRLSAHERPLDLHVLEARDRVGGRCWSSRGWSDGQVAEHGGELIEDSQHHVLGLVAQLGLTLEHRAPTGKRWPRPGRAVIGGADVTDSELAGFPDVTRQLRTDLAATGPVRFDAAGTSLRELDEMSVSDWLDRHVEHGNASPLGLGVATLVSLNLGFDPSELSALSLHHMFVGLSDRGEASLGFSFGHESAPATHEQGTQPGLLDLAAAAVVEVMHVAGGNDLIASRLAELLPGGALRFGEALRSVARRPDGRYLLRTDAGGTELVADQLVLALPMPPLRAVDLEGAALSPRRMEAIESLPMGTSNKLILALDRRPSTTPSWPGFAFTDRPPVAVWDSSVGQPGEAGLLTLFSSGDTFGSSGVAHGPAEEEVRRLGTGLLDVLAPGLEGSIGEAWLDLWAEDPWAGGGYAGFAPGQYARFAGFLSQPEGGIHFAGEHTSLSSPGYLDGAVSSGHRAAAEVLTALGL
jgi:monoamine oxidase